MLLAYRKIDVCVMTETHLNLQEVDDLRFPGYEVKRKGSRAYFANGGAIFIVHINVDSQTVGEMLSLPH